MVLQGNDPLGLKQVTLFSPDCCEIETFIEEPCENHEAMKIHQIIVLLNAERFHASLSSREEKNPLQNPQSWKGIVSFEHDEKYLADVSCTPVLVQ